VLLHGWSFGTILVDWLLTIGSSLMHNKYYPHVVIAAGTLMAA
jgi:hypothetical protein